MPNVMRGGMWFVVDEKGNIVDDNGGGGYPSRDLMPAGHPSYVNERGMSKGNVDQVDRTGRQTGVHRSELGSLPDKEDEAKIIVEPEITVEDIIVEIKRLDPNNDALWTASNKPRVEVLEEYLGAEITAEGRDLAWEKVRMSRADPGAD